MGVDVAVYADHSFPVSSGKELVKEFEKRFQCKCYVGNGAYNVRDMSEKRYCYIPSYSEGDADLEWKTRNELLFYFHSDVDNEEITICFNGPVAEIGAGYRDHWNFFVENFMNFPFFNRMNEESNQTYRKEVFKRIQLLGSTKAIYTGDRYGDSLLFGIDNNVDEDSDYTLYPILDQMIDLAKENGYAVFNYPVTKRQWDNAKQDFIYSGILIDDFRDLK